MPAIQENVHRYFATTVALVTSEGVSGPNVMACEWAMQVSYEPMLIAIFIHGSPTLWNIRETGAFGVNIASDAQAELVNVAGGYSKTELAKLAVPDLFETYRGARVPMIKGCALAVECTVRSIQEVGGDHVMVVGEVVSAAYNQDKMPLIYTRGNYRRLGARLPSGRKTVRVAPAAFEEFKRMSRGQFVLKCAAALVEGRDGGKKVLFARLGGSPFWMLPAVAVERGASYGEALAAHLSSSIGVKVHVHEIIKLKRYMLRSEGGRALRANFAVFRCSILHDSSIGGDGAAREGIIRWHPAATAKGRLPRGTILRGLLPLAIAGGG